MKTRSLYTIVLLSVLAGSVGCQGAAEPEVARSSEQGASYEQRQPSEPDMEVPVILFLGNSLAAGYGLAPERAFPALIQEKVREEGWNFEVVNAGSSGDTSAGGLSRIDWLLGRNVAVLVLELGGNDGLRGIPPEVTRDNLQRIIDRTRERHPDARILLAGMQMPPNMGTGYTERFRDIYPELARRNEIDLIPFLLEGVGGVARLNQPDGIHPTAEGQRIIAETVWTHLRPILQEIREEQIV